MRVGYFQDEMRPKEKSMTYKLPTVWSPQQTEFIAAAATGRQSLVLRSVAGSGKTTTLLGAVAKMRGPTAILAYNKKIAEEIKAKLIDLGIDWKTASAGTVHSFGFNMLRKLLGNVTVDEKKVWNIVQEMEEDSPFAAVVCQIVSLAKQRVVNTRKDLFDIIDHFDLLEDEQVEHAEKIVTFALQVLAASNKDTRVIDFDDMVYMPLIMPVRPFRFSTVIVDEAQDTNPARRQLVALLLAPGGRVIAVGDQHQAIYGFTGADNDSLDLIGQQFKARNLNLTVTYRCPKAVVNFSRQWVSHIEAHQSAPEGSVSFLGRIDDTFMPVQSGAILCRNTKPLVALAFNFIRRRIPCKIEGRDIGKGLVKLAMKWKSAKTIAAYETKLDRWFDRETIRLAAKEAKMAFVADQYETMKAIMGYCLEEKKTHMADVIAWIEELFGDNVTGVVVLSTIHKSKGREWNTVYWLNRAQTCPSRYATMPWMREQERNLCYVAATRAMGELIEIEYSTMDR
jgi:DNA helicase II / ATP-dependent DNA helicase PcrA